MRFHFLFASAVFLSGLVFAASDWIIEPGVRMGPITASTSEKDLVKIYGSSNVVSSDIDVGEGMSEPGTLVFPQSNRAISILWKSTETKTGPNYILIFSNPSVWKTKEGISLGISLKTIEHLNGGSFELSGFGWDYSGGVTDSNGGKLNYLSAGNVFVMLEPDSKWQKMPEYQSVIGGDSFSSSNPVMQKMNPIVNYMRISFNDR